MPDAPLPILYSFRRCPYAMRARLALAAAKTPVELREVILRDKPAKMIAASPKGTVPVLVLADGPVIDESLDIMLWALDQKDPEDWLFPDRVAMMDLIAQNDGPFKHHLDHYKYPNRYEKEAPEDHRQKAVEILTGLNERLIATGFLMGEKASLADYAILPFIRQFALTDKDWFDALPLPALQQWLDDFLTSGLFNGIMNKYAPWVEGAQSIIFPEQ